MVDPAGSRQAGQARPGKAPADRPPLLRVTLGGVLRRTRLAQRRTLADVAGAARVSVPYLSELERGRKEASSEVLAALCGALDLGLAELLAAAGRDLAALAGAAPAAGRAYRARVIRLGIAQAPPGPAPGQRPGDAQCLLAA